MRAPRPDEWYLYLSKHQEVHGSNCQLEFYKLFLRILCRTLQIFMKQARSIVLESGGGGRLIKKIKKGGITFQNPEIHNPLEGGSYGKELSIFSLSSSTSI